MSYVHEHKRKRQRSTALVFGLLCSLLAGYFGYHAMYGRFGIEARARFEAEARGLTAEHAALSSRHDALARDVELLRSPAHPDMIEEAARRVLGFIPPKARILRDTP